MSASLSKFKPTAQLSATDVFVGGNTDSLLVSEDEAIFVTVSQGDVVQTGRISALSSHEWQVPVPRGELTTGPAIALGVHVVPLTTSPPYSVPAPGGVHTFTWSDAIVIEALD